MPVSEKVNCEVPLFIFKYAIFKISYRRNKEQFSLVMGQKDQLIKKYAPYKLLKITFDGKIFATY